MKSFQNQIYSVITPLVLPPFVAPTDQHRYPLYFSFRSPYSYLALALLERKGDLDCFDPIAIPPMGTRGVALAPWKKTDILQDCTRLARLYRIPFGRIADPPLGEPAIPCLRAFYWLREHDPEHLSLWLRNTMRTIWAEGGNPGRMRVWNGPAKISGINLQTFLRNTALDTLDKQIENSRVDLEELYRHWGVPTVIDGDTALWGHDRLGFAGRALPPVARS